MSASTAGNCFENLVFEINMQHLSIMEFIIINVNIADSNFGIKARNINMNKKYILVSKITNVNSANQNLRDLTKSVCMKNVCILVSKTINANIAMKHLEAMRSNSGMRKQYTKRKMRTRSISVSIA